MKKIVFLSNVLCVVIFLFAVSNLYSADYDVYISKGIQKISEGKLEKRNYKLKEKYDRMKKTEVM